MKQKKCICSLLIVIAILIFLLPYQAFATDAVEVYAPSAILIEGKTGKVLYEKNADEKRYPASTTKIMTAILTIENTNLQDMATVKDTAILAVPVDYASNLLSVGEEMSIEELLYALLVKSCNEAANVLAEHVAGNIDSFASMMNTKAAELGCRGTHFVNPNGVHNENHYTTARDLAMMGKYAIQYPEIRKIVSTVSHTLPSTNQYGRTDRNLISTNQLINSKSKGYYEYANGIKTGYTKQAGNCMIAGSYKDGVELIAVVLGEEKSSSTNGKREQDSKKLFNFVYDNYEQKALVKLEENIKTIEVKGANKQTKKLDLAPKEEISVLLPKDNKQTVPKPQIQLNEKIKAPIAKGTVLGTMAYTIDNISYQTELIASHNVEKSEMPIILLRIALGIFILFLIYSFYKKGKSKKRRNKKKNRKYQGTIK